MKDLLMVGRGCMLSTGVSAGTAFVATVADVIVEAEGVVEVAELAGVGVLLLRVSDLLNGAAAA
jgi:hypothetical protein